MKFSQAAATLQNNGIICYPTEAVWGLGCLPSSESAFNRLLSIKKRNIDKGVILIASNYHQLLPYVKIDAHSKKQLDLLWPGFITCLLPKRADCPHYLSGIHDTLAVRMSTHKTVRTLCDEINTALVSTSANYSQKPPVKSLSEAKQTFGGAVDYYIDDALGGEEKPSKIIQMIDNKMVIIRD